MDIKKSKLSNTRKIIINDISHQNIGGKEIIIEGEVDCSSILIGAVNGNWACKNFLDRRCDSQGICVRGLTFYYGKVGGLGYIVASDELK